MSASDHILVATLAELVRASVVVERPGSPAPDMGRWAYVDALGRALAQACGETEYHGDGIYSWVAGSWTRAHLPYGAFSGAGKVLAGRAVRDAEGIASELLAELAVCRLRPEPLWGDKLYGDDDDD